VCLSKIRVIWGACSNLSLGFLFFFNNCFIYCSLFQKDTPSHTPPPLKLNLEFILKYGKVMGVDKNKFSELSFCMLFALLVYLVLHGI